MLILLFHHVPMAQPGASVSLPKPQKYENRKLASEKASEKPLNPIARANQNLNTKYNFHFNAGNKLNDVVSSAKRVHRDDYSTLLPFYNYSLDRTAEQQLELDSVILKCNNGILLHDLRNDWIDDLYLLMGRAYFFRKVFDSAAIAFQYINYAFQPRKKDEIGYEKYVASGSENNANAYTISTKEKKSPASVLSNSPARNLSILWLIRTLVEVGEMNQAWGLIETLKRDRNFPGRLQPSLEEMQALWFYRSESYDSAAAHLSLALDAAESSAEQARWEYLIAQLYERSGKMELADKFYQKAIVHTTDPVLEAYGRISLIRIATGDDEQERIKRNLEELIRMAGRGKYEDYRHIIYYAAARLELTRNDSNAAIGYLQKSCRFNQTDGALRNIAFLEMADIAWLRKQYRTAYDNYDSISLTLPGFDDADRVEERKTILAEILYHVETIRIEDSLQQLARMPEEARTELVKNLSRKLRKAKGLKEEENASSTGGSKVDGTFPNENKPIDIFERNQAKGEWYFYNVQLRNQGFRQFQAVWGNRPNVDNWRRLSQVNAEQKMISLKESISQPAADLPQANQSKSNPQDISVNGLMAQVPLTEATMQASMDTLQESLYQLARIFHNRLGDCASVIPPAERLLALFPETRYREDALFFLSHCFSETGNPSRAAYYASNLQKYHGQSRYIGFLNRGGKEKQEPDIEKKATHTYEQIYQMFIEGDFNRAVSAKRKADSVYGETYWSPQLLYIESVYQVRSRQDSLAMETLKKILILYPNSPMSAKAGTMLDVLGRRKEIESYLSALNVERKSEDQLIVQETEAPTKKEEPVVVAITQAPAKDSIAAPKETQFQPREKESVSRAEKPNNRQQAPPGALIAIRKDSSQFNLPKAGKDLYTYTFNAAEPHYAILLLDKVDMVYVNEARQAINRYNREKYFNQSFSLDIKALDEQIQMLLIHPFADASAALSWVEKARSLAPVEIFPWLPAGKYSFILISEPNIQVLLSEKKLDRYRQFLGQNFPGKF